MNEESVSSISLNASQATIDLDTEENEIEDKKDQKLKTLFKIKCIILLTTLLAGIGACSMLLLFIFIEPNFQGSKTYLQIIVWINVGVEAYNSVNYLSSSSKRGRLPPIIAQYVYLVLAELGYGVFLLFFVSVFGIFEKNVIYLIISITILFILLVHVCFFGLELASRKVVWRSDDSTNTEAHKSACIVALSSIFMTIFTIGSVAGFIFVFFLSHDDWNFEVPFVYGILCLVLLYLIYLIAIIHLHYYYARAGAAPKSPLWTLAIYVLLISMLVVYFYLTIQILNFTGTKIIDFILYTLFFIPIISILIHFGYVLSVVVKAEEEALLRQQNSSPSDNVEQQSRNSDSSIALNERQENFDAIRNVSIATPSSSTEIRDASDSVVITNNSNKEFEQSTIMNSSGVSSESEGQTLRRNSDSLISLNERQVATIECNSEENETENKNQNCFRIITLFKIKCIFLLTTLLAGIGVCSMLLLCIFIEPNFQRSKTYLQIIVWINVGVEAYNSVNYLSSSSKRGRLPPIIAQYVYLVLAELGYGVFLLFFVSVFGIIVETAIFLAITITILFILLAHVCFFGLELISRKVLRSTDNESIDNEEDKSTTIVALPSILVTMFTIGPVIGFIFSFFHSYNGWNFKAIYVIEFGGLSVLYLIYLISIIHLHYHYAKARVSPKSALWTLAIFVLLVFLVVYQSLLIFNMTEVSDFMVLFFIPIISNLIHFGYVLSIVVKADEEALLGQQEDSSSDYVDLQVRNPNSSMSLNEGQSTNLEENEIIDEKETFVQKSTLIKIAILVGIVAAFAIGLVVFLQTRKSNKENDPMNPIDAAYLDISTLYTKLTLVLQNPDQFQHSISTISTSMATLSSDSLIEQLNTTMALEIKNQTSHILNIILNQNSIWSILTTQQRGASASAIFTSAQNLAILMNYYGLEESIGLPWISFNVKQFSGSIGQVLTFKSLGEEFHVEVSFDETGLPVETLFYGTVILAKNLAAYLSFDYVVSSDVGALVIGGLRNNQRAAASYSVTFRPTILTQPPTGYTDGCASWNSKTSSWSTESCTKQENSLNQTTCICSTPSIGYSTVNIPIIEIITENIRDLWNNVTSNPDMTKPEWVEHLQNLTDLVSQATESEAMDQLNRTLALNITENSVDVLNSLIGKPHIWKELQPSEQVRSASSVFLAVSDLSVLMASTQREHIANDSLIIRDNIVLESKLFNVTENGTLEFQLRDFQLSIPFSGLNKTENVASTAAVISGLSGVLSYGVYEVNYFSLRYF